MVIAGAVNIILVIVVLASEKALAITPKAGEIAAPAIKVAIEIEMMVGFNILPLIKTTSFQHQMLYLSFKTR